jgi:hypothetical protein
VSHIVIGENVVTSKTVKLDVDLVLRTRLLIQGGSGSGKSWLLRRLAEQLFGKLPVIIIDPEGEFATLREQFGYVLVGQGGETPADVRSAGLVAHKLLELHASAVCDIYEMKPAARHQWVRLFLEALVDAPKSLWQPAVIIVDEAHLFAPEKGHGESSEASDAMIALTTRGRKRGFAPVFATQRLGKLGKDAAAELQNVIIGRTFIDIDRDRAVDTLGVSKGKHGEAAAFSHELKTLPEGHFWAFGPAVTLERQLVKVGPVQTTHPKLGSSKHAAEPPPAPDKVKALLPKLADLPQQAEKKALTEKELRAQLAEKDRHIRELEKATPVSAVLRSAPDKPILTDADRELLQKVAGKLDSITDLARAKWVDAIEEVKRSVLEAVTVGHAEVIAARSGLVEAFNKSLDAKQLQKVFEKVRNVPTSAPSTRQPTRELSVPGGARTISAGPPRQAGRSSNGARPAVVDLAGSNGHHDLTGPELKILTSIAELRALALYPADKLQVGLLAGYTNVRSGGFSEPLGSLVQRGFVASPRAGILEITDAGASAIGTVTPPTTPEEMQARVMVKLTGPEQKILRVLLEAYPQGMTKDDLGAAAGYTNIRSGGFSEPLGRLSTLGLVHRPDRGVVAASPVLFLEGR